MTIEQAKQVTEAVMKFLTDAAVSRRGYISSNKALDDDGAETELEEISFDGNFLLADMTAAIAEVEL